MATYTVLDLSKYNTVTNYTNIANSVNGVIIRAGYRGYGSSGTLTTDTKFESYYAGLYGKTKIGVYWLSQAINESEAVAEANYLYNLISNKKIDFPVYLDSEWSNSNHDGRADSLSKSARTNITIAFCERMKALGYRAGVYASDSWFNTNLNWSTLTTYGYSLWVAKYSSTPPQVVTSYDGWQYTDSGTISGVTSNVDLSYFYNDVAGWTNGGDSPVAKVDIATLTLEVPNDQFDYNGTPIQCPFTLKLGTNNLTPQVDFTYTYTSNTNAGRATCTITGAGNYTGSRYFYYYINPLDISGFVLTFDYDSTYDGNVHYAYNLKLYDDILNRYCNYDTDFQVGGYEGDTTNVGWVSFYVKGINNYTGSKWGTYRINAATIDASYCSFEQTAYRYTGYPITPPVISDKYNEGTDYIANYSNNTNIGTAICDLVGINNYKGTTRLTFKIVGPDIADKNASLSQTTYLYSKNHEPFEPTVSIEGLVEGTDFEVEYIDNEFPGTAIARAYGIGVYSGTKDVSFTISKGRLSDFTIELSDYEFRFTGNEIKPNVTISGGLIEDVDYELIWYNNVNGETATVVANGINNFDGQLTANFTIKITDISTCVAIYGYASAFYPSYYVDTGSFVIYSNSNQDYTLIENTDYIVTNTTRVTKVNYDVVTIAVKGIGGFSNNTEFVFNVIPEDLENERASESASVSESVSTSESISESISASESISEYQSQSASISTSESISASISTSESISEYQSQSASASTSYSISESISISVSQSISTVKSQSESSSLSESASIAYSEYLSTSESMSTALSESDSTEEFVSESISASISYSTANSQSVSASESASIAYSESVSESESISESVSYSISESVIDSESMSISESISNSISESESISIHDSESTSISESESMSESEYNSQSMEIDGDVEIWWYDGDFDFGEYVKNEETGNIDLVVDPDSVAHEDYDYNLSSEETEPSVEPEPEKGFPSGTEFDLLNTPIYATASVGKSFDTRSGIYYIYDDDLANRRIRICRTLEAVESPAKSVGWCNMTDLENLTRIAVGDMVKVTGKVYPNKTSRERYINMENETMFVRYYDETENIDCPYGLSFEINSAIIGYADVNSLTKVY